jgi:hypothetical protein
VIAPVRTRNISSPTSAVTSPAIPTRHVGVAIIVPLLVLWP